MAKLDDDKFDPFADTTPPRSGAAGNGQGGEETGQEPAVYPPQRPRQGWRTIKLNGTGGRPPVAGGGRPRAPRVAEALPELDKDVLDRWQWQLRATAGKAAAAYQRGLAAMQAWERLVADARKAGVPERLPTAAALEADIDLPATE